MVIKWLPKVDLACLLNKDYFYNYHDNFCAISYRLLSWKFIQLLSSTTLKYTWFLLWFLSIPLFLLKLNLIQGRKRKVYCDLLIPILAVMFRPFNLPASKDFYVFGFPIFWLSVPGDGYSRSVSCTLNYYIFFFSISCMQNSLIGTDTVIILSFSRDDVTHIKILHTNHPRYALSENNYSSPSLIRPLPSKVNPPYKASPTKGQSPLSGQISDAF